MKGCAFLAVGIALFSASAFFGAACGVAAGFSAGVQAEQWAMEHR